jgi:multiple sugar transport system permease protein
VGPRHPVPWIAPSLLLILLVIAFPAAEMVRSLFLRITQTGLATGGNGLGSYQRLLREPALPGVVWHTVLWVVLVVGVTVLVSLPLAHLLDKTFAGRRLVRLALLVPWAASLVMTLVDTVMANLGLGLRATWSYWAIILVYSAFNLAFAVWILSGYFRSITREIEEAALIDGLGRLRVLLRVVLPLAKPGVVTALIFTFIQVWNEFVVALTLFNDPSRDRQTLTVGIQQFVGQYETRYQYLFVASLIGVVPVLVLFATIERYLMGGLTAGSVK